VQVLVSDRKAGRGKCYASIKAATVVAVAAVGRIAQRHELLHRRHPTRWVRYAALGRLSRNTTDTAFVVRKDGRDGDLSGVSRGRRCRALAQHANAGRVLRTARDYPPDVQGPPGLKSGRTAPRDPRLRQVSGSDALRRGCGCTPTGALTSGTLLASRATHSCAVGRASRGRIKGYAARVMRCDGQPTRRSRDRSRWTG
jgi:hypothetical protein